MSAGSGELPCLAILWYTVQCRAIRNLKKGPKKAPQLGFDPQMYCYASGVNGLDLHGFYPIQCFGGKTWPKSYCCYGLLFGEIDFKNTIGRAFHGDCQNNCDENSKFDPFLAKS